MAKYFLDTGIILGYIRATNYAKYIENTYNLMSPSNISIISIVSVGEIYSLAYQFQWGEQKKKKLDEILYQFHHTDINMKPIIQRYAEIDAYSQGKLAGKKLPKGMTSRNMGKNDLWIAATASIANATLLTTDKDFDHLNHEFLEVIYINPSQEYSTP